MATSSLLGIDRAPSIPRGRDAADLGPSDTSDSGSDVAGLGDLDEGDPGLPADVAAEPDRQHSDTVADAFSPGADSDHTGTGERRSAAGDAGRREAADIAPDSIVSAPGGLTGAGGAHEDLLSDGSGSGRSEGDDMDLIATGAQDEDDDAEDEGSGRPSP
ncbi:MAG: hypothetical protein H0W48_05665 [Methylibium sp.]|nr:hypothetical protein [Methylibium sp.]